mgnify:FL=1
MLVLERTLSDEEKIRKAIEISQRRNNNRRASYQEVSIPSSNSKKEYKLFKRMIMQVMICALIYLIFYLITTTNYVFSEDVINKTNSILNYDIEFYNIYKQGINKIKGFVSEFNSKNGGNVEANEIKSEDNNEIKESENAETKNNETLVSSISQMEKDAEDVKKFCDFQKPLSGKITSEFGEREVISSVMTADHKGIDIAANSGTDIQAAISGQVVEADSNSEYGKFIKIKNEDVLTVYAHCSKLKVKKGDSIEKGDVIAEVGSTGKSTGPHLHFEIRLSDRYINPRLVIQF